VDLFGPPKHPWDLWDKGQWRLRPRFFFRFCEPFVSRLYRFLLWFRLFAWLWVWCIAILSSLTWAREFCIRLRGFGSRVESFARDDWVLDSCWEGSSCCCVFVELQSESIDSFSSLTGWRRNSFCCDFAPSCMPSCVEGNIFIDNGELENTPCALKAEFSCSLTVRAVFCWASDMRRLYLARSVRERASFLQFSTWIFICTCCSSAFLNERSVWYMGTLQMEHSATRVDCLFAIVVIRNGCRKARYCLSEYPRRTMSW